MKMTWKRVGCPEGEGFRYQDRGRIQRLDVGPKEEGQEQGNEELGERLDMTLL